MTGKKASQIFANESGGHRIQRIPPTERNGRVHTSTITVAVLNIPAPQELKVLDKDLEWTTRRGSGPGGQHRNKTESCVDLVHKPSGIKVTCDSRSQFKNKELALKILMARLSTNASNSSHNKLNEVRKSQIGCGMRGDKRRTISMKNKIVTDHELNITLSTDDYYSGKWDKIINKN